MFKKLLFKVFSKIACFFIVLSALHLHASTGKIFVLEIRDEIDPRMSRYVNLALEEATSIKADYVIVDMNTFGGAVDDADKIRTALLKYKKPVYVFVNKNAASAGALIAIACDSIYMEPGSNIGAATVVSGNDGMPVPEKYQSYMRSMMRSTAEVNHRDPTIAEAFVDPDINLDSSIKKPGKVLTFTTEEAIKNHFCEASLGSLEGLLAKPLFKNMEVIKYKPTWTESVIYFFLNPAISGILILIMIGGIYFEFQHPGIGFPIVAAIIAAILYFTPFYLNGLAQNWEILLFFIGIILLGLEFFVIPGFGVTGITGLIFMFASLILSMLNNNFFNFDFVNEHDITYSMGLVLVSFIATVVLAITGSKRFTKTKYFKHVSLSNSKITPIPNKSASQSLLHLKGISHSVLRPSGKVEIEGEIFDAYTNGEYIDSGEPIIVVQELNGSLKVKKLLV